MDLSTYPRVSLIPRPQTGERDGMGMGQPTLNLYSCSETQYSSGKPYTQYTSSAFACTVSVKSGGGD